MKLAAGSGQQRRETTAGDQMIRSFRELTVYQKAFDQAMRIFEVSKTFPKTEQYSLTDQIRRSSRSVTRRSLADLDLRSQPATCQLPAARCQLVMEWLPASNGG